MAITPGTVSLFARPAVGVIGGIQYVPSGCLHGHLMHANFESGDLRVLRIDPKSGQATEAAAELNRPNGIVLYSPAIAEHDLKKNDYLRFDSRLGRRVYEICVLVTAREMDHQFEWAAHEPAALKAGVEPAIVDIVKHRRATTGLARKDAVLIELGREVFARRSASSAVFAEALKLYGPQALVEAVSTMGQYANIALLLNAFDQQLAPGQQALLPVSH